MSTFAESQHPRGTGGRFSPKTKAGAGVGLQTDGCSPYRVHADRLAGATIRNVIDTVHFVRSETNRGVQLADLVAYGLCRLGNGRWDSERPGDKALANMFRDSVLPHVRTYRQRWPKPKKHPTQ